MVLTDVVTVLRFYYYYPIPMLLLQQATSPRHGALLYLSPTCNSLYCVTTDVNTSYRSINYRFRLR